MPKSAKVKPAEYVEPEAAVKPAARAKSAGEWELGKPAPATRYLDYDSGEIVDTQPVRAQVIVFEGGTLTEPIMTQLGLL